MEECIERTVEISAGLAIVWNALTNPAMMKKWMGGEELQLEIETDWNIGSLFIIRGFHHQQFENGGRIIEFNPFKQLIYTHLSSLSNLNDEEENHCVFNFKLVEDNGKTILKLVISNFPTESIYKHLELYWRSTLTILKQFVETEMRNN